MVMPNPIQSCSFPGHKPYFFKIHIIFLLQMVCPFCVLFSSAYLTKLLGLFADMLCLNICPLICEVYTFY